MYCVIQKINNKKAPQYGASKEIEVYSFFVQGRECFQYGFGSERFSRDKLDAYKITLRESYREDGRVKQKQWAICTMGYYAILEYCLYDYADGKLNKIADETGISVNELYDMIEAKLNPIREQIEAEFSHTEEFKAKTIQDAILSKHRASKAEFEKKYGDNSYDYCYDVFGELRNESYLKDLEASYSSYQEKSYSNYGRSSYQDYNWGNYSNSSYQGSSGSNYTSGEEQELKKIYKKLSIKLHPDNGGSEELMKMLNRLKEIVNI